MKFLQESRKLVILSLVLVGMVGLLFAHPPHNTCTCDDAYSDFQTAGVNMANECTTLPEDLTSAFNTCQQVKYCNVNHGGNTLSGGDDCIDDAIAFRVSGSLAKNTGNTFAIAGNIHYNSGDSNCDFFWADPEPPFICYAGDDFNDAKDDYITALGHYEDANADIVYCHAELDTVIPYLVADVWDGFMQEYVDCDCTYDGESDPYE